MQSQTSSPAFSPGLLPPQLTMNVDAAKSRMIFL